jgi:hypothetical protein
LTIPWIRSGTPTSPVSLKFLTPFLDTGYAFSGAEGNSTLVTDNLSNRLKEAMFKQFYGKIFDPNLAPVENPPTT